MPIVLAASPKPPRRWPEQQVERLAATILRSTARQFIFATDEGAEQRRFADGSLAWAVVAEPIEGNPDERYVECGTIDGQDHSSWFAELWAITIAAAAIYAPNLVVLQDNRGAASSSLAIALGLFAGWLLAKTLSRVLLHLSPISWGFHGGGPPLPVGTEPRQEGGVADSPSLSARIRALNRHADLACTNCLREAEDREVLMSRECEIHRAARLDH